MPGEIVDGNDVVAVEDAVERALARARDGEGPTFLEMKTFRRMQHSMRANLPDVRDAALVAEWDGRDPLPSLERLLRNRGELDDEALDALTREIEGDVEHAISTALADPDADPADLMPAVLAPQRRHPAPAVETERMLGFVGAVRESLALELEADPDVFVMGEDVGRVGGLFRATEGLYERFGAERIRDTPLTESGFVGCGIGAALTGLRPVVELQFSDFAGVAFDQIMNQAAKLRFMMSGSAASGRRSPPTSPSSASGTSTHPSSGSGLPLIRSRTTRISRRQRSPARRRSPQRCGRCPRSRRGPPTRRAQPAPRR